MRRDFFSQIFDFGKDILCTTLDAATGVLLAQTGDSTTLRPDADNAEWWQHTGVTSRPAIPSVGNASCQALVLKSGDRDIIFATRDVRGTAILGNLADGETCVYAASSQARTTYKADGSINHLTTSDNKNGSGSVSVFQRVAPTEFRAYSPNCSYLGDATGWHFRTWQGAKFDMMGLGLPAPFSALGIQSVICLTADVITLDAAVLNLGRVGATGIAQPVVQALPLAADMALLATALTNVSTALADVVVTFTGFVGTGSFPGIVALTPDVLEAQAAIAAVNAKLALVAAPVAAGGTATNTGIA